MRRIRYCARCSAPWSRHVASCPRCGIGSPLTKGWTLAAWGVVAAVLLHLLTWGNAGP